MAAPGYPQMGQMPPGMGGPGMGGPMGGPPMGGPPMGGPPTMNRPVRRGTSKAVPVVVSAGLAVGVFCGLLFGVGTGKDATASPPPSGSNVKKVADNEEPKADPGAAPKGLGATTTVAAPKPPATGSGAGSGSAVPVAAAAGSGAGSAAPAAGSAAAPVVPEKKLTKITFKVKPEAAAKDAKLTVDGKEISDMMVELPVDQKSMKVEIKASGYRTFEKKQDIASPGEELTIEYELVKKPSGNSTPSRPRRPERPPTSGGLIDI